ncbi:MAG: right-handed parallel beta-helix repeat-containing protein [Lentisphaerae bacterium]|nr:right-handed parallel beta-helix repeat-containing protein [Lentisphaerota bacterium]
MLLPFARRVVLRYSLVLSAVSLIPGGDAVLAATLYVQAEADAAGSGATWASAYNDFQEALSAALPGDDIWVAAGLYLPNRPGGSDDPRAATFRLSRGVAAYGGFTGKETSRAERNHLRHLALLSGDLHGDDNPLAQIDTPSRHNDDNAEHVVTGAEGAILDGFVIIGGNATNPTNGSGGGLYMDTVDMEVRNCGFIGNLASQSGGALYGESALLRIHACYFWGNAAQVFGGGAVDLNGGEPCVTDCVFAFNRAGMEADRLSGPTDEGTLCGDGGGLLLRNIQHAWVLNSHFFGNEASGDGGGIYSLGDHNLLVFGCVLAGNAAGDYGGGIYRPDDVISCTIAGNYAKHAGGGVAAMGHPMNANLRNCILFENGAADAGPELHATYATLTIADCMVTGGLPPAAPDKHEQIIDGGNNRAADPLFKNLLGEDGIEGTLDDNFHLRPDSPARNTGNIASLPRDERDLDLDGNYTEPIPLDAAGQPRVTHGYLDLGAYEEGEQDRELSRSEILSNLLELAQGADLSNARTRSAALLTPLLQGELPLLCIHPRCPRFSPKPPFPPHTAI